MRERYKEPEITDTERKHFKLICIWKDWTVANFADPLKYRPQFIRQILCNDRQSNYAVMKIRDFIKEHLPKMRAYFNKLN